MEMNGGFQLTVDFFDCEEIREKVGNGIYVLIEKSLPQGRSNPNYDACMKEFPIHYKAHMLDNTKPYEGIMDAPSAIC